MIKLQKHYPMKCNKLKPPQVYIDDPLRGDKIIIIHSLPTAGNCSGASRLRSFRLSAGSPSISGTENLFQINSDIFRLLRVPKAQRKIIFCDENLKQALLKAEWRTMKTLIKYGKMANQIRGFALRGG